MSMSKYNCDKLKEEREKTKLMKQIEQKFTDGLKFIKDNPCRVCDLEELEDEGFFTTGQKWYRLCTNCGVNKFDDHVWNDKEYIFYYCWESRLFCVNCVVEFKKLEKHPLYWECVCASNVLTTLMEKIKE